MKQTFIYVLTALTLIAAMSATAEAQQKPAVVPPQAQRPRTAAQQPLRDGKAAKQATQESQNLVADQPNRNEQQKLAQQRNQRANAIVNRYVVGFQANVGLTDEQARTFGDLLGKYVRMQLNLAQIRTDALKRLKELTAQNASEDEILTQTKLVDTTETRLRNAERNFYNNINPKLTPQQQGKLRVYLTDTAQDLRQAIQKSSQ